MRVTFKVAELKQRLAQLSTVVAKKSQEALYRNVRLFTNTDGVVIMQGIDIDTTMTLKMPAATFDGPLNLLLEYQLLNEISQHLTAPEASITTKSESEAVLSSGKFKARLRTFPTTAFTDLPLVAGIDEKPEIGGYTFGLPGLKAQIDSIDFAVPAAEGRHVVASALLSATATDMNVVGTDGVVLAIASTPSDIGEFSFTMPKPALEFIKKLDGGGKVTISDTEGAFFIETEIELITYNKTHAEFPNFDSVVKAARGNNVSLTFKDKEELVAMILRLKPLTITTVEQKERPITFVYDGASTVNLLAVKEDKLTTGNTFMDMGYDMALTVDGVGAATRIRFDALKLLPFLERAVFPVTFRIKDAASVSDLCASGGTADKPAYRVLMMPMRSEDSTGVSSTPIPQSE